MTIRATLATVLATAALLTAVPNAHAQQQPAPRADTIPLPEHPRPDFQRADWVNLNGRWQFAFDPRDAGVRAGWYRTGGPMPDAHRILVPFSWAAPASGVGGDSANIGWYARNVTVPAAWASGTAAGGRVFLVVGASDWRTSAWLDGDSLGTHQGGYTPFSMELTRVMRPGTPQRLVLRVDDTPHPFRLDGKQGYGNVRGLWQTAYLEARGAAPLEWVHFTPDVPGGRVTVEAKLLEPAPRPLTFTLTFRDTSVRAVSRPVARGATTVRFDLPVPHARLWSPEDPYLYETTATLGATGLAEDRVETYFGMRSISVVHLPGTTIPYVALNGKPVYLQLALDQAYHPTGYYTFPTDSVLRDEILRARQIGLTGLREHIKIEAPRKLYWADRLGVLIMADVPNWWGPPDSAAFAEHDVAMRGMIARDYNHPSVFSWITFNESWGLTTQVEGKGVYLPATQAKVASVQQLAKRLDPTRLVEDNSPCCGRWHTTTDLNSWHEYLPGWQWQSFLDRVSDSTFAGSPWHFIGGRRQAEQPMMNSEFGNVWGYEGSTGDVDWSWDYHRAVDAFRRHPKVAGWLYTEHSDVINEWNGYWRFDRSPKETGVGALVPGMTLADFHAPLYVAVGDSELARTARPGERVSVPLYASFLTGSTAYGDSLTLRTELSGWTALGEHKVWGTAVRRVPYRAWMSAATRPTRRDDAERARGRGARHATGRRERDGAASQLRGLRRRGADWCHERAYHRGHARRRASRARGERAGRAARGCALVREAVDGARRAQGERRGKRLLRVSHPVAGGPRRDRRRGRDVPGGGIEQAPVRQGPRHHGARGRRLHARWRAAGPGKESQCLPDDRGGEMAERGDGACEWHRGGAGGVDGRPGR